MTILKIDVNGDFVYTNGHAPFNTFGEVVIGYPLLQITYGERGYNLQVYYNEHFVSPSKIYVYLSGTWVEPKDILVYRNNSWVSIKKS